MTGAAAGRHQAKIAIIETIILDTYLNFGGNRFIVVVLPLINV